MGLGRVERLTGCAVVGEKGEEEVFCDSHVIS